MSSVHRPVMLREVLEGLRPRPGGRYIDGTFGGGGHTAALLDASSPDGRVLALDADEQALARGRALAETYGERLRLVHSNFRAIHQVATRESFVPCDGVLLDIGLSSDQLSDDERGFSFLREAPLDMRFDRSSGPTAADLLNHSSESELADIFYQYGEERRSRRLARAVTERRKARPFESTADLLAAVERGLGPRRGRLHPATRVFQALRIAVNDELGALREALAGAVEILAVGGRLVVISFHSLEDRIVKQFIASRASGAEGPPLRAITRKPIVPSETEVADNPRSRSAKLRVAERSVTSGADRGG